MNATAAHPPHAAGKTFFMALARTISSTGAAWKDRTEYQSAHGFSERMLRDIGRARYGELRQVSVSYANRSSFIRQ